MYSTKARLSYLWKFAIATELNWVPPPEIREVNDHLEVYVLTADPIAAFRGSLKSSESKAAQLTEEHR